jgi:hypothetical protein
LKPQARTLAAAAVLAGIACGWMGCAQIFGIDDANAVPDPNDAAAPGDATQPTDGNGGGDATDGGHADGGGSDAISSDAPAETCASRYAQMISAPITPAIWGGLDFSNGGQYVDVPGGGGLTMGQTGLVPCADFAEPTSLPPGVLPINPGYRTYGFGVPDGGPGAPYPFELQANLESGVIGYVQLQAGYTGTLKFGSRPGGTYGSHTYEIAIGVQTTDGGPVATGGGYVKRDGADFAADWSEPMNDAGVFVASAWANELYDGLMATFSPTTPAIADCLSIPSTDYQGVLLSHANSSCLYDTNDGTGNSALGIRPIRLYFYFNVGTNQTTLVYYYWNGGATDCTTAVANTERMDFAPVTYDSLGGLYLQNRVSNTTGLTYIEADKVECSGMAVTPPDPGYGAYQWGQNGEVEAEYVLDSGLIHELFAKPGYVGSLVTADATGANYYVLTIGTPATDNGAPFTIDWPTSGTPAAATTLSNAYCTGTDTDCVAAGDCTVSYDGSGNMVLGFLCGEPTPTNGVVFTHDTSTPQEFFATNPLVP